MHVRKVVALVALLAAVFSTSASARVVRFVIDTKTSPAFNGATFGNAGQYETLAGRAFGELDPRPREHRQPRSAARDASAAPDAALALDYDRA